MEMAIKKTLEKVREEYQFSGEGLIEFGDVSRVQTISVI